MAGETFAVRALKALQPTTNIRSLGIPGGRRPTCVAADCAVLKAFERAPVNCPDRLAILLCHDCPSSCSPFLACVQNQGVHAYPSAALFTSGGILGFWAGERVDNDV